MPPNGQWVLPIPATFVIDAGGVVARAHVEADYRQRSEVTSGDFPHAARSPLVKLSAFAPIVEEMASLRSLVRLFSGQDAGTRRLLRYWTLGLMLYVVSLAMLWFEASLGVAPRLEVMWLTAVSLAGAGVAYGAIKSSVRFAIPASVLNAAQCSFAIACVVAAYALVGPMRGVTLCILVVVLVFGGFSSAPGQMRAMCLFAVVLLGLTIWWKSTTDATRYPQREELVHFVLAATMLMAVAYMAELLSRLRRKLKVRTQELADALSRIQDLATRDELTQLVNRRQMIETLELADARRERSGEPACVAVIDIDHFKRINDTLGHAAGDVALKCFSQQALCALRRCDVLARWGGEEFLLLLPATGLVEAMAVLERLRMHIRHSVEVPHDPALGLTFSAGLVEVGADETFDAGIDRADRAMYRAKREGRDRVTCAIATQPAVLREPPTSARNKPAMSKSAAGNAAGVATPS